jgi:hypothetical protein
MDDDDDDDDDGGGSGSGSGDAGGDAGAGAGSLSGNGGEGEIGGGEPVGVSTLSQFDDLLDRQNDWNSSDLFDQATGLRDDTSDLTDQFRIDVGDLRSDLDGATNTSLPTGGLGTPASSGGSDLDAALANPAYAPTEPTPLSQNPGSISPASNDYTQGSVQGSIFGLDYNINYNSETTGTSITQTSEGTANFVNSDWYVYGASETFNSDNMSGSLFDPAGGNTNPNNVDLSQFGFGIGIRFP